MQRFPGPFELIFDLLRVAQNVRRLRRAAALGIVLVVLMLIATALSSEVVTFTVEDRSAARRLERLPWLVERELVHRDPRSGGVLVIETSNEVFEVSWSFVYWKFDKYDRWNFLQPGSTYSAVVTGWRIPLLGQYRNIVQVIDHLQPDGQAPLAADLPTEPF